MDGMFEFGRDLRKLFERARESDDLGWVELIGADLVLAEARGQTTDAGRVSCARPHDAWLRASALWREHARRTGRMNSLDRAMTAAGDAANAGVTPRERMAGEAARAETLILGFDLFGGPGRLLEAGAALASAGAAGAGAHARLKARRARLTGQAQAVLDAGALLDAALTGARGPEADELRLERAALGLEAGLMRKDPRLLDQAGRDLRQLVESASPDYRPVTRARALALCGAGLKALAAMAGDRSASAQGQAMFEAAADQFTPDHSPLDWAAIQVLRAETEPLQALRQAVAATAEPGLMLGGLTRAALAEREAAAAEAVGDVAGLDRLAAETRRRLATAQPPLDWAADQVAMAEIALARARLTGSEPQGLRMTLVEAAETAREEGCLSLASRAERLLA